MERGAEDQILKGAPLAEPQSYLITVCDLHMAIYMGNIRGNIFSTYFNHIQHLCLSLSNHKKTFLKYGAFKIGINAIKSQFSYKYLTDSLALVLYHIKCPNSIPNVPSKAVPSSTETFLCSKMWIF